MKRKNLIAKRKAKKIFFTKDRKINSIYLKFRNIIFKKIEKNNFALAVSGGADSLCLAYFGKIYSSEFKNKIYIIIVDHKLRKESRKESLKVKEILKKKGINSKILTWNGKIPKKNIQSNARNIRYSLISKYCLKNKIKYLITAHHMDDQIENFFIRLIRGSGLRGLSSMSDSFDYGKNFKIIRPFLSFKKNELQNVTLKYFKKYIKDPSNEDNKYLRVRVRKYRKKFENEGLSTDKVVKTINNLLSANKTLDFYKNKALRKHTSFVSKEKCLISMQIFFEEGEEIIFKSFSDILSLVSGTYYPPRSNKVINLINRIKKRNYNKSTLGGCIVEKKEDYVEISKELRSRKISYQLVK